MNIPQTNGGVNRLAHAHACAQRDHIATIHPLSAPQRSAGYVYEIALQDEVITLLSSWRIVSKQMVSNCLNWDCQVIEQAITQYGVTLLEVFDKPSRNSYMATIDTLKEHGQIQTRWASTAQWALHVKYYAFNGTTAPAFKQTKAQPKPEATQGALFAFADPVRKGGAY